MRQVLYNHVKMSDKYSRFAETGQQDGKAYMEVVIPTTPEAENMVEMMNKNMVGYLRNYLSGEGISNKDFMERLLHVSCDKPLFHTAAHCT